MYKNPYLFCVGFTYPGKQIKKYPTLLKTENPGYETSLRQRS